MAKVMLTLSVEIDVDDNELQTVIEQQEGVIFFGGIDTLPGVSDLIAHLESNNKVDSYGVTNVEVDE